VILAIQKPDFVWSQEREGGRIKEAEIGLISFI
jgi:hypothetical protein